MKLFNSLSKSATECDKQIMKYIENNTDSFVEEGIIKTAQKCFVSAPMITKFAKKYGYKGYKDMQISISMKYSKYFIPHKTDNTSSNEDISKEISSYMNYSIDSTVKILDYDDIFAAASLVHNSKYIFIFGAGSSNFAAENLKNKFRMFNMRCHTIVTSHDIKLWGEHSKRKSTVLIIFSHSMISNNLDDLIQFAENNGIFVIVITANEKIQSSNKLLKVQIKTIEDDDPNPVKWYSPKISLLLVSDIIIEIMRKNFFESKKQATLNKKWID